ncbi:MAG: hypothetical protein FJ292_10370 [Planctomycetes bacterium]|nr:hypothetical protein [Planctomycetota bacterium]
MAPKDDFDLSPAERERIRTIELFIATEPEDGRRIRMSNPIGWVPIGLMVVLAVGFIWASEHFGWKRNQSHWSLIFLPLMSLLGVSSVVLGLRGNRRGRWRAMRAAGYDICIGCGYRLDRRAPGSDRCPECGKPDADQVVKGWPPHPARQADEPPAESP